MKSHLKITTFLLVLCMVGILTVKAGYYTGSTDQLYFESSAGVDWRGLWVDASLSGKNDWKRVYAQSGGGGTYSAWEAPETWSAYVKDHGSFTDDFAVSWPEWRPAA